MGAMKSINFRTENGKQLIELLKSGDVPIHVPTPRNVREGDKVKLTYGSYANPKRIAVVTVVHEHRWTTDEGKAQESDREVGEGWQTNPIGPTSWANAVA